MALAPMWQSHARCSPHIRTYWGGMFGCANESEQRFGVIIILGSAVLWSLMALQFTSVLHSSFVSASHINTCACRDGPGHMITMLAYCMCSSGFYSHLLNRSAHSAGPSYLTRVL